MKTISLYLSLLIIVIVASLSSCALKKDEFAQRKYYNFPRAKHVVEKPEPEHISVRPGNKIVAEAEITSIVQENKSTYAIVVASANNKGITLNRPALNTPPSDKNSTANRINKKDKEEEKPVISYTKSDVLKLVRKNIKNPPTSNSSDDGMLILMVLAAIFIPPLGVYLKEKSTTQWFWITLVLCLASIVFGYGVIPGLFGLWFVAAIIALLVVFDAI